MDERFDSMRASHEQGSSHLQYDVPEPHLTQAQRLSAPRQRYRATQCEHPVYDVVEDDGYQRDAPLDPFVDQIQQLPYPHRQYQSAQDPARLFLVSKSSRNHEEEAIQKERPTRRTQCTYREEFNDIDEQPYPDEAVRASLNRFVYKLIRPSESSPNVPVGASSSPALNAGRRRIGHCWSGLLQRPSRVQPFEDLLPGISTPREDDMAHAGKSTAHFSTAPRRDNTHPSQQVFKAKKNTASLIRSNAPPTVQGIPLVPTSALPERLQAVFPFPAFNAVQSKCFDRVFKSDSNFVLSSPTGSGKTAILELAVCRAIATNSTGQYKVVYQAPTKALCSERQRDWDKKFTQIGLRCAELTGDSDGKDLRNVQSANIIITTPEKWDSMTRKWKDHEKLLKLIKLFLIDEVHILNEDRGAVLEAVVSRMKSISADVRFVALSATVPNFKDVAAWLGKSSAEPYVSAPNEWFGEEFRPVKLKRHVCGYIYNGNNDWAFEKQLDARLPEIIGKYSEQKPMMIFCATRKSCATTAALIADWWATKVQDRLWEAPSQALYFQDSELGDLSASGVAFHHAGVAQEDRIKVEQGFLQGDINVICCTSTLAVGVNLPCHLVIIKNTMSFSKGGGLQEYSDLDMMQMLGRAGRPQFDDSAVAVIMTRHTKVRRYEILVTGRDVLESKLHLNLIEHMNAEIGLGTIRDFRSARKWLTGTFLYVRMQQNPAHYKLKGSRSDQDIQEQVDDICFRDITLLKEHNLATGEEHLRCTEFGHAMARYYVQFETMKIFMGLRSKSTLSEILSATAQAAEFSKMHFRQGEKSLFRTLNKSPSIRFPIPVNLDLPAQKVSLLIQSALGHADMCWDGDVSKHKQQYLQEVTAIFKSINSLVRCIIDCQIFLGDSVGIHSALTLERALGSKSWDDSPLQMIQIPDIGTVAVRKLVNAGIRSIEDLEVADPRRIEMVIGRNPPFGLKVLEHVKSFPKLRISLHIQHSTAAQTLDGVKIQVKADIGFMNEKPADKFVEKPVYVCMLAETSDGRKAHFERVSGSKLGAGQSMAFPVFLTSPKQSVNCYIMCEGMAGTMREATVVPRIATTLFSSQVPAAIEPNTIHRPNISRRRLENVSTGRKKSVASDEYGDADIDDDALVNAMNGQSDFEDIDNFAEPAKTSVRNETSESYTKASKAHVMGSLAKGPCAGEEDGKDSVPVQLSNGRWACFHKCKNKEACKHYCCKHGMERPPKKPASKRVVTADQQARSPHRRSAHHENKTQIMSQLINSKRKASTGIEELDLTLQEKKHKSEYVLNGPHDYPNLNKLRKSIQEKNMPSSLHSAMRKKSAYCYGKGGQDQLSFLGQTATAQPEVFSEHGDLQCEEVDSGRSNAAHARLNRFDGFTSLYFAGTAPVTSCSSETFGKDDSVFDDTIVGLTDSQNLRTEAMDRSSMQHHESQNPMKVTERYTDVDVPMKFDFASTDPVGFGPLNETSWTSAPRDRQTPPQGHHTFFIEATNSPQQSRHFWPPDSIPHGQTSQLPQPRKVGSIQLVSDRYAEEKEEDVYSDLLDLLKTPLSINQEDVTSEQAPAASKPKEESVTKKAESQHVPDGFKDLQPWLFQEFGDIVELVDE